MGSDLFALSALAKELNEKLAGARIDKIQQPNVDEFRFYLRCQGKNEILCMSCNAQAPRIHLTTSKKQSPINAPALCMLFRKYLISAVIESISIFNDDRIIQLKINGKTEMKDDATYYIFVEIMNRYSNIVFTDSNLIIIDSVKHLPLDIARDHVVLHGIKYAPVKQQKISYLNNPINKFIEFNGGDLQKFIIDNLSGFAGLTASELLFKSQINPISDKLTTNQLNSIENTLQSFIELTDINPCVINNKEVYPIDYECIENRDVKFFNSMSEAYDFLYTDQDLEIRNKSRLKTIANSAKKLRQKIEKNIVNDIQKLKECENMDIFKTYGELIVNNIYKIKKGDKSIICYDYYNNTDVEIELNEQLSPSKNSNAYFEKYNKLKRTKEFVTNKLEEDKELLEYVKSIEDEINNLPYDADTSSIEDEILLAGGGKRISSNKKIRNPKAESPYTYLIDGFYVYRGKTNIQNEEITFKLAESNDLWLHLKNEHGAHTIIVSNGKTIPERIIKIAAEITASTKNASSEVDYTIRKNVKRKPNGHLGQVIYVNYKTILVNPDSHKEFLLKS